MQRIEGFAGLSEVDEGVLHGVIELALVRASDDPDASLVHQRRFLERLVLLARKQCGLGENPDSKLFESIRGVADHLRLNRHLVTILHDVRLRGNGAAHTIATPGSNVALAGLRQCHELARWLLSLLGRADLEPFRVEEAKAVPTARQQQREAIRKAESALRIGPSPDDTSRDLSELLRPRPGGSAAARVVDTVPDAKLLRWVYFATPTKANSDNTYDFAYSQGVVCCNIHTTTGSLKPNVGKLRQGDIPLLAYGERGVYKPQLYLRIDAPAMASVSKAPVMARLRGDLAEGLDRVGYSVDPVLKVHTGFLVTPCSDWKDHCLETVKKPTGQNFLRTWAEVRDWNKWASRWTVVPSSSGNRRVPSVR
jgi:hypothetical protein